MKTFYSEPDPGSGYLGLSWMIEKKRKNRDGIKHRKNNGTYKTAFESFVHIIVKIRLKNTQGIVKKRSPHPFPYHVTWTR